MIKNQANIYQFVLRDMIGQGMTGLLPTVQIRKDTGSFSAATNAVSEVSDGLYELTLTATECNCDIMAIKVSLPDGQFPAILANEYLTTTGGATPAEIWQYNGGRTVDNSIPTVNEIWGRQAGDTTSRTLTNLNIQSELTTYGAAKTTDLTGLATSQAVANIATVAGEIKAKTDNLPASPAAVGSEMALTNAAISAVQNGLATSSELSALETHGDLTWATATGFTVPADLANLATVGDISSLASYGDTKWLTATGFATPSDIPSASDNASAVWSADSRTLTESALTAADVWSYSSRTLTASALTAQDIWEYTARTLTSSPTDISTLATKNDLETAETAIIQALPDVSGLSTFDPSTDKVTLNDTEDGTLSAIKTKVDTLNNTDLTGIATSKNVSDAQTAIIAAIPTDYAKPGNAMTLTSSTIASVLTGVWNYENRSLTEEISVSITTEDINNICAGVWSYVPRRLTSIVSDVIEPNKP